MQPRGVIEKSFFWTACGDRLWGAAPPLEPTGDGKSRFRPLFSMLPSGARPEPPIFRKTKYKIPLRRCGMPSPASHLAQLARDHAQDLVSSVMPIGVVEILKVINVDNRKGIRRCQTKRAFMEGTPRRQGCQFIVVSQGIGCFHDRARKNNSGSRDVDNGNRRDRDVLHRKPNCR